KGIRCRVDGRIVIVGSRAYLRGAGVFVPEFHWARRTGSDIFVAESGQYIGRIRVADVLRPGAKPAIESLQKMGIRTLLLTGDVTDIADAIGRELGVDEVKGGLLPEDKLRHVQSLRSAG